MASLVIRPRGNLFGEVKCPDLIDTSIFNLRNSALPLREPNLYWPKMGREIDSKALKLIDSRLIGLIFLDRGGGVEWISD